MGKGGGTPASQGPLTPQPLPEMAHSFPQLLTLAPNSRAAAVSKAMVDELGDLGGREGRERVAAGTGASAAAPQTAPTGGQG